MNRLIIQFHGNGGLDAFAELREANLSDLKRRALDAIEARLDAERALNAELLEALKPFANLSTEDVETLGLEQEVLNARAALAKAEGRE